MKFFSSRHSRLHRPTVWRVGAMLVPLAWSASSAVAQPQPDPPAQMGPQGQSAFYQWSELQRAMAQVELREPAQAVAAYQKFYETSGHQDVQVAVAVTSRIAQLWGRDLKNPGKAVEIYARALEQWEQTPYGERLRREAEQMKALASHAPNAATPDAVTPDAVTPDAAAQTPASVAKVPSPVSVPTIANLPLPVSVPSIVKLPSAAGAPSTAKLPSAAGVAFVVGGSALAVTVEAIQSGRQSAEAAWKHGDLSVEQALALLDQLSTRSRGTVEGRIGSETRRALARLVVAHAPQLVERPQALGLTSRLWVGEVLGAERDERAVPLLKSVLSELKGRTPLTSEDEVVWAFLASERLAWFYRDTAQHQQAAQSWLGVGSLLAGAQLSEQRAWYVPDALFQAGRAYLAAGEQDKAQQLYAQVPQYKEDLFTALVTYDRVGVLLRAGKSDEAQQLAREVVQGTTSPVGRAISYMLLAQSLYASGDFAGTQAAAQACIEESAKVKTVGSGVGFGVVAPTAQDLLKWSKLWQEQPLICSSDTLKRKAQPQGKSWKTRITVRSFKAVPLNVKCDDTRVKCTVVPLQDDPWFPRRETRFAEQIIEVEVPLTAALQTELHISSAQLPGASCDIPLQISS